jgi:outer membrane biosynthesis protein TonB
MPAPVMAMKEDRSTLPLMAKGKVLSSDDNMPIPGASVYIKGTKTGVITDTDGNFSINIPDSINKTLVADFIGMDKKEVKVKPGTQLEVMLDPSVSALSEVVVTGYGVRRADSYSEDVSSDHTTPQPVDGKSKFDKYIRNNIHRPDSLTTGQRVVVVLSFLVHKDGSLDSIRIIRSPGRSYSDEAIRLLESGPAWIPAKDGGKPVDEEVRLRVVFK